LQKVSKKGRSLPPIHPKFIRDSSARAFLTAARRILFLHCEKGKSVCFLQRERTGPILDASVRTKWTYTTPPIFPTLRVVSEDP
jgi:hypothetical protein